MYSFYEYSLESFKNNILPILKISLPITYRYNNTRIDDVIPNILNNALFSALFTKGFELASEIQYVGTQYTRLRTRIYTVYTVYVRWLQAMVTVHSVCVAYVWDHKVQFDPLSSVDGMWNAAVCLRVDGSSEISPLLLRSTLCGVQVMCW